MNPDLRQLTQQVIALCQEAERDIITPIRLGKKLHIEGKDTSGRNFVTQADLATERFLKEALGNVLPVSGFIAEESFDGNIGHELNWIIDPIDGTTNFMHDLPPFCISVALAQGNEILLGVIYELFTREVFHAWRGGGAWLNGKRMRVSPAAALADSLLVTGFPYEHGAVFDEWLRIFGIFLNKTQGVRRLGSAAIDMAYVAAGRFDAFYEYNLNPWDVAAGVIITKEAGGMVTDFRGGDNYLFGKEIICSNGHIHASILSELAHFAV